MREDKPCIVQRDFTVLLEMGLSTSDEARSQLQVYAELVKSPVTFHTYRITPLSLWHAASMGWTADGVLESLNAFSRWEIPILLQEDIRNYISRYGQLILKQGVSGEILLQCNDPKIYSFIKERQDLECYQLEWSSSDSSSPSGPSCAIVPLQYRGLLKQELTRLGYPVQDLVGYHEGTSLSFQLGGEGRTLELRDYQKQAAEAFAGTGGAGGNGVLVLPCGAGKTVIGMAVLERLQCEALILTSNTTSVRQWMDELKNKTDIPSDQIGEYSGQRKQVRPVTVATYQILTHRRSKAAAFEHMKLLSERDWGLIIYDEVHLLPAPVFRATADIQATRRLGLTATLVREDGCERDVFSLVGPKRYDMPWKQLEAQGWIAKVECVEVRIPMTEPCAQQYILAEGKDRYRIAAENPAKLDMVRALLKQHAGKPAIVIGQYLDQLKALSRELGAPLISGSMAQSERVRLFEAFRTGELNTIIVSKVANFAVDLPDAALAIEVSGSYGSRQEEAQRLGRILRPKADDNRAYFYALVTADSKESEFAARRQLFLIEQGYEYAIHHDSRKEA
ncbi:DNA repair helicase XPB [Paenibacillus massiliensis]|uniref:DNA repair helicase XPB n=1 Tax=Paenibacillus massiliensis TaxID=225917 RepID=UPI000379A4B3|nr:DNA repair helicase XPB [Paenibacillus massiliensis]